MIDTVLVDDKTVVTAKGDGPAVDVGGAAGRVFLLTLEITKIIEQESLDLSCLRFRGWYDVGREAAGLLSAEVLLRPVSAACST